MGLLSWLFPKPADRIAKAKKLMAQSRFAEARLEVVDLEEEEAVALKTEAERALVKVNLERAQQFARAGDVGQVESCLNLAQNFSDGSQTELFEQTMEVIQSQAQERAVAEMWADLRRQAERRRRLGADPGDFTLRAYDGTRTVRLFFGAKTAFSLPGLEVEPDQTWFRLPWVTLPADPEAPTTDELAQAKAALVDAYPSHHADDLAAAGDVLARAVMDTAAGHPERAVEALIDLPADNLPRTFELGRAAAGLGVHQAAAYALKQFAEGDTEGEGKDAIVGGLSFRALYAAVLRWADVKETAYEHAVAARALEPAAIPHLFAALAIETRHFDEAEAVVADLADDNASKLQLASVLRLQRALAEHLEARPIVRDEAERMSPEWQAAVEEIAGLLQSELDEVMAQMRDAEDETAADGDADAGDASADDDQGAARGA